MRCCAVGVPGPADDTRSVPILPRSGTRTLRCCCCAEAASFAGVDSLAGAGEAVSDLLCVATVVAAEARMACAAATRLSVSSLRSSECAGGTEAP